jgi:hypothetical protein
MSEGEPAAIQFLHRENVFRENVHRQFQLEFVHTKYSLLSIQQLERIIEQYPGHFHEEGRSVRPSVDFFGAQIPVGFDRQAAHRTYSLVHAATGAQSKAVNRFCDFRETTTFHFP